MTLIYINSSATESPFAGLAFSYFFNETFEDGLLDTLGVTATTGVVVLGPGPQTGSVDADDGVSGGFGTGGHSWFSSGLTSVFTTFEFNAAQLGGLLPTPVGIVWTGVGISTSPGDGAGEVVFEAFDANGLSLGALSPVPAAGWLLRSGRGVLGLRRRSR